MSLFCPWLVRDLPVLILTHELFIVFSSTALLRTVRDRVIWWAPDGQLIQTTTLFYVVANLEQPGDLVIPVYNVLIPLPCTVSYKMSGAH